MKNIKTEIIRELVELIRSNKNFEKWDERMICVLLQERLQHDRKLRDIILASIGMTLVYSLDDEPEIEVFNTVKSLECEPEPTDEELATIEAEMEAEE